MKPMRMSLLDRINAWKGMYKAACEIMAKQSADLQKEKANNFIRERVLREEIQRLKKQLINLAVKGACKL